MPDKLAVFQAVFFIALLCAASVTDLTKRIIPNWLCLGIAGVSIIGFTPVKLLGILIALPFLLAAVFFGGMGGGDIKLMAAAGLFLGWQNTLLAMFFGIVFGGMYGIYLLAAKKAGKKDHFAFGPFLCAGIVIAMLFGGPVLEWYCAFL